MSYALKLIPIQRKEKLADRFGAHTPYEVKSDVYGCCIKLLTDTQSVATRWGESFYFMSQNIRSHGRLYVVNEPAEKKNAVYYDAQSKTAFLLNFDYYGWIKSLALSVAGDVLEDEHDIYSIHGACLDVNGQGVCILGESGAGKTTHTYGLLRRPDVRVVSDDWFYVRVYGQDILAYSSEKNFYIRADLAKIWSEFNWLVERAELDGEGRAVVDLRLAIGKGRILPLTTLRKLIILKRDARDPEFVRELTAAQALEILERNDYFNPHLLVSTPFKRRLRKRFFRALLERVAAYEVNTTEQPEQSQTRIRKIVDLR
ncbi:MAG: HPr kinase/phosphorylase [Halobacteriota archaeon]